MKRTLSITLGLATLLMTSAVHAEPPPPEPIQAPRGEARIEVPRGDVDVQAPRGSDEIQAPRDDERVEAPRH